MGLRAVDVGERAVEVGERAVEVGEGAADGDAGVASLRRDTPADNGGGRVGPGEGERSLWPRLGGVDPDRGARTPTGLPPQGLPP